MMFKIAFRNVFRQKRRTILTVLTMFGGFTLASISIAWSDGSYNNIISMFTRNRLGHIQIHARGYLDRPSLYKNIQDYEKVGEIIAGVPGVEQWTPRLYSAGLVSVGEKSAGAQIIGIDPEKENSATRFDKKIISGRGFSAPPAREALLGEGLARVLKARVDDEVVIVSQAADGSIANDVFTVIGLVSSGDQVYDQTAFYLPLRDAQELLALPGKIHELVVIVADLDLVLQVAADIERNLSLPELAVAPWQEFAKSFYTAMKADQQGSWIMLFVITLVVTVGVLNTVLMTVLERIREYGVMRALGTSPGQVFRLVQVEVIIMAVMSVIIGCLLAYVINYALSIHGITMPTPFTYGGVEFTTMYTELNTRSFYIPGITVVLAAVFISIFPALKAARTTPVRAMRMH
ncbi:MAG: ABC transporter permease [candidate division Zixibacteria bacterium]|nr:ABC transporter permease [candidate division Zixibacteria bacterium]